MSVPKLKVHEKICQKKFGSRKFANLHITKVQARKAKINGKKMITTKKQNHQNPKSKKPSLVLKAPRHFKNQEAAISQGDLIIKKEEKSVEVDLTIKISGI